MNNENQPQNEYLQPAFTEQELVAIVTALVAAQDNPRDKAGKSFSPEFFQTLERVMLKLPQIGHFEKSPEHYQSIFLEENKSQEPSAAPEMKILHQNDKEIITLGYYQGKPVRFHYDKATKEVHVNADDLAKALGFEGQEEMMSSDEGLDAFLEYQKQNPGQSPLKSFESGIVDQNTASLDRNWWQKDITVSLSPRERGAVTEILLKYKNIMIDGFELEEKDYDEVTPATETDLWAVFAKLNPHNYDKPV